MFSPRASSYIFIVNVPSMKVVLCLRRLDLRVPVTCGKSLMQLLPP